jgi:hypothetical protein
MPAALHRTPRTAPLRSTRPREAGKAVALVAVIIATLAVAGGAYYLLAVRAPMQQRAKAQVEVERWEERLGAARACLLGDAAGSRGTREALAIRELSPDPWNRGTCTQLISRLSRGETEDTGMPAVEEAWRGLERAAGATGAAFLAHVDPMGEPAENRKPDALPLALEGLAAAHAQLRAAAGLPPPPARAAAPPLPAIELVPLRDGDAPVTELASWTMPTMGGVVAFGSAGARELQITLVPGAPAAVRPVGNGILRTVPDAAWGAGGGPDQVMVGPLDEAGALAPLPEAAPDKRPPSAPDKRPPDKRAIQVEGRGRVFAVAGTAEDGLVVAGGESSLVLIRSQAGKLTAETPVAIEQLAFALDPAGRALVAYNDEDGKLHGFVARGAAPAKALELGESQAGGACLTAKRAWIAGETSDQIVSFDTESGAVTPHTYERHDLLGCTAGAALLQQRNASHFVVCADACRVAALQGMRPSKIAALAGDEVVSIVVRDQVLGIWREQGPARYFATPAPLGSLHFAISDGKVIDVVAQGKDGVVIARVPAR